MAMINHVTNARDMEISNLSHGRCDGPLQYFKSFAYKTAIPADEHAAASDNVAVTCVESAIMSQLRRKVIEREISVMQH